MGRVNDIIWLGHFVQQCLDIDCGRLCIDFLLTPVADKVGLVFFVEMKPDELFIRNKYNKFRKKRK